jgi:hypothetical protein
MRSIGSGPSLDRLIDSWRGVLDTTLCDKVCQWLATELSDFLGYSGFDSTNITDRHEIAEIFLKVALNTINQPTDQINRGEVWAHTINLTPPLFIEVSVPSQGSERSYICVRDIDLSFLLFWYWILEPFRQCGMLVFFHFYPLCYALSYI